MPRRDEQWGGESLASGVGKTRLPILAMPPAGSVAWSQSLKPRLPLRGEVYHCQFPATTLELSTELTAKLNVMESTQIRLAAGSFPLLLLKTHRPDRSKMGKCPH